jgi:uncharacterized membrane protein YedE/YeeE
MAAIWALAAGLIFGTGLIVSGLANPAKVLAFLDLAGRWDPSLLVLMATGIAVSAVAYAFANRRRATLFGGPLSLPTRRDIDSPLILGAVIFGVGWGLVGICPGPALVVLGSGRPQGVAFVLAMLAGMGVYELYERVRAQRDLART